MKRFCLTVLMGLIVGCAHADKQPAVQADNGKSIVLIAVGDIDSALLGRLQKHVQQALLIPVETVTAEADEEGGLDAVARSLTSVLKPQHAFGVALYAHDRGPMSHGVVIKDERIALVNATAMRTEGVDEETYARRLERQALRSVCFLLGMSYSPNMRSAMYNYEDLEELDSLGRNLDPPWMILAERAAREQGIAILSFEDAYMQRAAPSSTEE